MSFENTSYEVNAPCLNELIQKTADSHQMEPGEYVTKLLSDCRDAGLIAPLSISDDDAFAIWKKDAPQ